jgi:hypothetical protein
VSVTQPVRRARIIALTIAVMIGAATVVGSYVAVTVAVDKALTEMNRRSAARNAGEAVVRAILEQNRRTHCSEMRALLDLAKQAGADTDTPAFQEIDKLYAAYHCGTAREPIVPPGWKPPPGWPELPPGVPPMPSSEPGPPAGATVVPPAPDQPTEPGVPAHPPVTEVPAPTPVPNEGGTTS